MIAYRFQALNISESVGALTNSLSRSLRSLGRA